MTLTAEQVDQIFETMNDYSRKNFGLKNGVEFPSIAQALIASRQFRSNLQSLTIMALLTAAYLPVHDKQATECTLEKLGEESPMRSILADLFFAGFKFGLASAEAAQLQAIADLEDISPASGPGKKGASQ